MAQARIDQSTAYPLSGTALAPDLIGITLSTTLALSGSLSSADEASVVAAAQAAAADYINNLGVGETLVLNEIADRIRSSDARIFDVGRPNQPLDEVFLWRSRADVGGASAGISFLTYGRNTWFPACAAATSWHPPESLPHSPRRRRASRAASSIYGSASTGP